MAMAKVLVVDMERSQYCNPNVPIGYEMKEPELLYKFGREINGVHCVWTPYIYDAHIDEREDFATLSDLIMTSDEECIAEATVNANVEARTTIPPRKIKKEKVDENDGVEKRHGKHGKKGHESDTTTLGASLSQMDIEEKGAKKKKKIKIKKERRSGSSSSSSRHGSPVSSRRHISPPRRRHGSPLSHRHRSPSPGPSHRHHSPLPGSSYRRHSPSSRRQRSISPFRKHHSPPSSKRHHSPSRDKIVSYSPERYRDVKVKQEYIKQEYYDVKVKDEPLEPPEHLHGSYHCVTCNITMNSLLTYNTHLNGKRHLKNMKVKNLPDTVAAYIPATVISEDQSKYPQPPTGVIRRKVNKPAEIQKILETFIKQPCPGLSYVTEIQGISGVQYYCAMCDAVCSSNSITAHLTGFKHQLRTVKQFKPGAYEHMQNAPKYQIENELKSILRAIQKKEGMGRMAVEVEEMDANDVFDPRRKPRPPVDCRNIPSTSGGITKEQSGMSFIQRYDKATIPDMTASDYFCEICQSHMNSLQMWEAHIRGKRHLTNLKKMPGDLPSKTKTVLVPNKKAYLLDRIRRERIDDEPFVGLKEVRETEVRETNSHSYQCFLCGSCHTTHDILEHLMSLKHRTKYLDHVDFPGREVISGMSDSMASNLVRDMCIQVEKAEGMGKPAVHVNKSSLQTYR